LQDFLLFCTDDVTKNRAEVGWIEKFTSARNKWEKAYVCSDGSCKTLCLRMWRCNDRWWGNARNAEQGWRTRRISILKGAIFKSPPGQENCP
jgi:hypothetical protein